MTVCCSIREGLYCRFLQRPPVHMLECRAFIDTPVLHRIKGGERIALLMSQVHGVSAP